MVLVPCVTQIFAERPCRSWSAVCFLPELELTQHVDRTAATSIAICLLLSQTVFIFSVMIHFKYSGNDVSWQTFATMTDVKTAMIMRPSKFKRRLYYRALPNISLQPVVLTPPTVPDVSAAAMFYCYVFLRSNTMRELNQYLSVKRVSDRTY